VGCALEDLVTAQLVYHTAVQTAIGNQTIKMTNKTYDFAVVGAGVFRRVDSMTSAPEWRVRGAAGCLRTSEQPCQFRRETPLIRMGYGPE